MTSVKFSYDTMTQVLYEIASDSADEQLGDCDYGWMALFLVYEESKVPAAEWSGDEDFVIPAGTFAIVEEVTSGAVGMATFPTDTDAQETFDQFAYHFAIWEEARGY